MRRMADAAAARSDTPEPGGFRLAAGERVGVRLETAETLAAWAPGGLGAASGLHALVFVEPGPIGDRELALPPMALRAGAHRVGAVPLIAAGPAADGAAVGWVHLPLDPGLVDAIRAGEPVLLVVDDPAGGPAAEVQVPHALLARGAGEGEPAASG